MRAVIATGYSDSGWEMLVPLLRQLLPTSIALCGIDQLTAVTAPQSEQHYLLCYTSARTALAHAVRQGLEPEDVLANWQAVNRQLLAFQRRQRRSALLIDAERACACPEALLHALQHHAGLVDEAPANLSACEPSATLASMAFERWLAGQWLAHHEAPVQQLETELEVSGLVLPPPEETDALAPAALWSLYRGWQARLSDLTQARDTQATRAATYQQQLDEQTQAVTEQQKQLEALTAEKNELSEENELLLLQLHQVQEELETFFLKNQALEPELNAHRVAHEQLRTALIVLDRAHEGLAGQLECAHQQQRNREREFVTERQVNRLARQQLATLISRLDAQARPKLTPETPSAVAVTEQAPQQSNPQPQPAEPSGLISPPPQPMSRKQLKRDRRLLAESPLFDASWYAQTYLANKRRIDPAAHYLTTGVYQGFNPSLAFDTNHYLRVNPDVAKSNINPLVHYLRFGQAEKRSMRAPEQQ